MSDNQHNDIELTEDPNFSKGFNNGWIIAKHEPEVSKALVISLQMAEKHQDIYFEGMQEGILHHELERAKDRFKDYEAPDKGKTPDKGKGRTKD